MYYYDYEDEYEVPKHYKKKPSKSVKKSKHKHLYKDCILKDTSSLDAYSLGKYCTVCGKLGDITLSDYERIPGTRYFKVLNKDDFFEKHKDLEIIEVTDLHNTKYINIKE